MVTEAELSAMRAAALEKAKSGDVQGAVDLMNLGKAAEKDAQDKTQEK